MLSLTSPVAYDLRYVRRLQEQPGLPQLTIVHLLFFVGLVLELAVKDMIGGSLSGRCGFHYKLDIIL